MKAIMIGPLTYPITPCYNPLELSCLTEVIGHPVKTHILPVVKFTEIVLGKDYSICLDRIRRKRHRAVYDLTGTISKSEAHHVVKMAVKLLNKVENELESN